MWLNVLWFVIGVVVGVAAVFLAAWSVICESEECDE